MEGFRGAGFMGFRALGIRTSQAPGLYYAVQALGFRVGFRFRVVSLPKHPVSIYSAQVSTK